MCWAVNDFICWQWPITLPKKNAQFSEDILAAKVQQLSSTQRENWLSLNSKTYKFDPSTYLPVFLECDMLCEILSLRYLSLTDWEDILVSESSKIWFSQVVMPVKSLGKLQSSKSVVKRCNGESWGGTEKPPSKTKGDSGGDNDEREDLEENDVTDLGGSVILGAWLAVKELEESLYPIFSWELTTSFSWMVVIGPEGI